jgi:hypothetical protein
MLAQVDGWRYTDLAEAWIVFMYVQVHAAVVVELLAQARCHDKWQRTRVLLTAADHQT